MDGSKVAVCSEVLWVIEVLTYWCWVLREAEGNTDWFAEWKDSNGTWKTNFPHVRADKTTRGLGWWESGMSDSQPWWKRGAGSWKMCMQVHAA